MFARSKFNEDYSRKEVMTIPGKHCIGVITLK